MFSIELTEREHKLIVGGGIVVMIAIFYFSIHSALQWLDQVEVKKNHIINARHKIASYGQQYDSLKRLATEVSSRSQKKDITPIIEQLLDSNGLTEKVRSLNPSNSVFEKKYVKYLVTILLRDISAPDILNFLKSIENYSSAFLKVDYFNSRPALRKVGLYNCQIRIATFIKKK